MRWEEMAPSEAVENADWIGPRLHPWKAHDVGMVIPTGFEAYARILHPAQGDGPTWGVRWSAIARWSGKTIHPEVQFVPITEPAPGFGTGPKPWRYPPRDGTLEARQVEALVALLAMHTATPGTCWFCLWEGFGYLHPGGMAPQTAVFVRGPRPLAWLRLWSARRRLRRIKHRRPSPARVNLPNRSYLLFAGSVRDAAGWEDGPNLWWPDDRTWCVASEIDLGYTYVGGSNGLIKEVLEHPELEAVPADIDDGVTYDSDKLNS